MGIASLRSLQRSKASQRVEVSCPKSVQYCLLVTGEAHLILNLACSSFSRYFLCLLPPSEEAVKPWSWATDARRGRIVTPDPILDGIARSSGTVESPHASIPLCHQW